MQNLSRCCFYLRYCCAFPKSSLMQYRNQLFFVIVPIVSANTCLFCHYTDSLSAFASAALAAATFAAFCKRLCTRQYCVLPSTTFGHCRRFGSISLQRGPSSISHSP